MADRQSSDHRAIASLTYEAWKTLGGGAAFYFYEVSNGEDTLMFRPTDYVDITDVQPIKRQACYAHASQTPDRYYALQIRKSADFAKSRQGLRRRKLSSGMSDRARDCCPDCGPAETGDSPTKLIAPGRMRRPRPPIRRHMIEDGEDFLRRTALRKAVAATGSPTQARPDADGVCDFARCPTWKHRMRPTVSLPTIARRQSRRMRRAAS